jgi:pimeloyl-ACP methyl ester carboxylesterase
MASGSAVARLQRATTISVLICGVAWLAWYWDRSPLQALAGFLAITMGYSLFLAMQFLTLRIAGGDDAAPRPTWGEVARAWWCETLFAAQVFSWRQPFRWRAVPDQVEVAGAPASRRGAVFIHGFVCNRGFWTPWLERMRALGHPFIAVNLEPVFGSIDEYVPIVEDAVQRMTKATGLAPVLVCHSMGGLAARAWLGALSGGNRVHHVITIGSPHHGTWPARFSRVRNGVQMQRGGQWLRELRLRDDRNLAARFTCWYSNCDNIVFPASTATLEGADNRLVRGAAHIQLAFDRRVMDESFATITGRPAR